MQPHPQPGRGQPYRGQPERGQPYRGQPERPPRSLPLLRTMLGGVLRQTRRGQGRTLADVARAARVSMPYLSELERGRKEASSEVLAAICAALGIDLSDLLASAGRELAAGRAHATGPARRSSVIRLVPGPQPALPDPESDPPVDSRRPGPADAGCLLAA